MTVIVEFSLPVEAFPFGRATSGDPDVGVQLERVVPLDEDRIPFLWATDRSEGFERFERHLRESEVVRGFEVLARADDSVLYHVQWYEDKENFLNGLADTGGSIMEAHGDSTWSFTVRFPDHASLTRFHQFYQAHDYPVHIDRVYAPDDESRVTLGFGLTPEQRESLLLAVEDGYFSVPRETTLDEIAEDVGITRQAASERVRRGAESVLQKSLFGLAAADLELLGEVVENEGADGGPRPPSSDTLPGRRRCRIRIGSDRGDADGFVRSDSLAWTRSGSRTAGASARTVPGPSAGFPPPSTDR